MREKRVQRAASYFSDMQRSRKLAMIERDGCRANDGRDGDGEKGE